MTDTKAIEPDTRAIERGTYAVFALATPNDGDQTVEVLYSLNGYHWRQLPTVGPQGPFDSEQAALNAARAHYGY